MKKFLAIAALAVSLTACTSQAPEAPQSAPSVSQTVKPSAKPSAKPVETPKPVEVAPAPVETSEPAPMPVVVPEVPVAPTPVVETVAPAPVYVAPENYTVDAPEYVEPAPVAPVAPVTNPAPFQTIPVPVETFVPHTFAEPTPAGMPAELTRPTCDASAGYVFDYTSMGCLYVGDANLGRGMGGNVDIDCNAETNNKPGRPSCASIAASNGF